MNYDEIPQEKRPIEIFRLIKRGEAANRKKLSELFKVSERTISTYISKLQDIWKVTIRYDKGENKYIVEEDGELKFMCRANPLTADDVIIILFTLIKSKNFMPFKMNIIQSVLINMLPKSEGDYLRSIIPTLSNEKDYTKDDKIMKFIEIIRNAIGEEKKIEFSYKSPYSENIKIHIVTPYSFACELGKYYLIAKPDNLNELTHYRIDRIKEVNKLNEEGLKLENFNVESYLKKCWYMYSGEETTIRIKFKNEAYEIVTERNMMEGKCIEKNDDYFLYEIKAYGINGILIWILSFGDMAEVIEPKELRDKIKNISLNMAQIYKNELS